MANKIVGYISAHAASISDKLVIIPDGFRIRPLIQKGYNLDDKGPQFSQDTLNKLKTPDGRAVLFEENIEGAGHIYESGDAMFDMIFEFDLNHGGIKSDSITYNNKPLQTYLKDNQCDIAIDNSKLKIRYGDIVHDYRYSSAGIITGNIENLSHNKSISNEINESMKRVIDDAQENMLNANDQDIFNNKQILRQPITLGVILKKLQEQHKQGDYLIGACRECADIMVIYKKCRAKIPTLPETPVKIIEKEEEKEAAEAVEAVVPAPGRLIQQASFADVELSEFKEKIREITQYINHYKGNAKYNLSPKLDALNNGLKKDNTIDFDDACFVLDYYNLIAILYGEKKKLKLNIEQVMTISENFSRDYVVAYLITKYLMIEYKKHHEFNITMDIKKLIDSNINNKKLQELIIKSKNKEKKNYKTLQGIIINGLKKKHATFVDEKILPMLQDITSEGADLSGGTHDYYFKKYLKYRSKYVIEKRKKNIYNN